MFTEVNGDSNIAVFHSEMITKEKLEILFKDHITYTDCFELHSNDLQYYVYEPFWITPDKEQSAIQKLNTLV